MPQTPLRAGAAGFFVPALMKAALQFSLCAAPIPALADCAQQLQLLGEDLRNVALTETQKQAIGGIFDDARRYCWVHQEKTAMDYIVRARKTAGIGPPREEFDWENVPLESLEEEPKNQ